MNLRENFKAVLHGEHYDALPIVCFGYWNDTIDKWEREGHLRKGCGEEMRHSWTPHLLPVSKEINERCGFDFNYFGNAHEPGRLGAIMLDPPFEPTCLKELPDGGKHMLTWSGLISLQKYDQFGNPIDCIPATIGSLLDSHDAWVEKYLPRLQWRAERVDYAALEKLREEDATRTTPLGLNVGSLVGWIRNMMDFDYYCEVMMTDEDFMKEMVDTFATHYIRQLKAVLNYGIHWDYAHYWEDLSCKSGPLVDPKFYHDYVGPYYKQMTDLLHEAGVDIISVDNDGITDDLIPTWIENGINTVFPIEYGTWGGNYAHHRMNWGKQLHGVGGMRKHAFAEDKAAVDAEIERLRPMIEMGGYLPTPDHLIPPDSKFELVCYYTEQMRKFFT